MSGHTPGPWAGRGDSIIPEAHKAKSLGGSIDPAVDAERFAWPIANFPVNGGLPRWTAGQKAANARLIAAAPELLEALQKLIDRCDDSDDAQYGTLATSFVRDLCRDAIAKATGEQP